jgi:alpha/beta superfamily hydrolase
VAVICHPHPQHGGTLNNKVVHQLALSFRELGAVSVRFNFRGVGESQGDYDEGRGEQQDLSAVVGWARERWPDLPLWLGGFSFGAMVAIRAAESLRPQRLVTVAPAVNHFAAGPFEVPAGDWLVIHGDADEIVPVADVRALAETSPESPHLIVLNGAGHFFHGRLNDLKRSILEYFSVG